MGLNSVQVIAVTGGKGGVGKTSVSVNLAVSLAELGKKVVLLDADLGLANVDIMLGIKAKNNLHDVLEGRCDLVDILVDGPKGIKVVPAASGTQDMVSLNPMQHAGLVSAFSELRFDVDVLVIDTAAGISETVLSFINAAQETLMVVCNEPTSITDAYALIKILNQTYGQHRFNILANMIRSQQEGRELFGKLMNVTDRFLDVALSFTGAIPYDDYLRKSIKRQSALVEVYPRSKAAIAFKALAKKVSDWPLPATPRGRLEFFVERLVQGTALP